MHTRATAADEIDVIEKKLLASLIMRLRTSKEGRITVSNFYRVFIKVESVNVSEENSVNKLVDDRLLGKAKPPTNLPVLKYGRNVEPIAIEEFI